MMAHAYPSSLTPCCGRPLGELRGEVFVYEPELVTCGGHNLHRGLAIVDEIRKLDGLLAALKQAFAADELDGGWRTALEHPLYLKAEQRKTSLREELKGLI